MDSKLSVSLLCNLSFVLVPYVFLKWLQYLLLVGKWREALYCLTIQNSVKVIFTQISFFSFQAKTKGSIKGIIYPYNTRTWLLWAFPWWIWELSILQSHGRNCFDIWILLLLSGKVSASKVHSLFFKESCIVEYISLGYAFL